MIIGYEVIVTDNTRTLEKLVKEKLEDGWALQGGCSVARTEWTRSTEHTFTQAVIKRKQ